MTRIDRVTILLETWREFEGADQVTISFVPTEADDPLLRLIHEYWRRQDAAPPEPVGDLFIT